MFLYLLRHADASDGQPDADRALSPKGRSDVEKLGRLLTRSGVKLPELTWCSPYRRAGETAEVLRVRTVDRREMLTPYDDPAGLLPELAEVEQDLLIVGHNPHLSVLAGYLLGGLSANVAVRCRKCTLLRFERIKRYTNDPQPTWVLDWMLPPKLYR